MILTQPTSAPKRAAAVAPDIRVGFILSPSFTLLPFAGFVDTLRHSADEGDRSRQVHCQWTILGATLDPVRSSCGAEVMPWQTYGDPAAFDHIVIVGGLTPGFRHHAPETFEFLRLAHERRVGVVGLCTGSFAMAEAGLLRGRRCAVHFRHRDEFLDRYPGVRVTTHELYVIDGDLVTCIGGTAAIDVAVELIARHCGRARALKGLADLMVDEHRTPQGRLRMPYDTLLRCGDWRVERAVKLMYDRLSAPVSVQQLARQLGVSVSQLDRAFAKHSHMTAARAWREIRLLHARWLLLNSSRTIARIARECGFADSAHLNRRFRQAFGETPRAYQRVRTRDVSPLSGIGQDLASRTRWKWQGEKDSPPFCKCLFASS